jgi:hypothetical protein
MALLPGAYVDLSQEPEATRGGDPSFGCHGVKSQKCRCRKLDLQ